MHRVQCFCAFCRAPRKVYRKKRVGIVDIMASALGAGIIMYVLFREFDPRVLLIFVILLAMAEVFIQIRWRLTMVCKHCGFDPVLYLKNVSAAVSKVQKRLEQRKNDPATLLSTPLRIAKRRASAEKKQDQKGQMLSKQI